MPYASDINLGLGEVPKTTDPAIFPDMMDIYNAIHILGQAIDIVSKRGDNSDSSVEPWKAMPFKDWIWVTAALPVTSGQVVTVIDYELVYNGSLQTIKGAVPGAGAVTPKNAYGSVQPLRFITGIALADAAVGEKLKLGIGPAVMNVPGIKAGTIVYAKSIIQNPQSLLSRDHLVSDGTMYSYNPDGVGCIIGLGVGDDALMINGPNLTGILARQLDQP